MIKYKPVMDFLMSSIAQYPDISDDLVNSYHLLLCCVDLAFGNIVCVKQHHGAISPEFKGMLILTSILWCSAF